MTKEIIQRHILLRCTNLKHICVKKTTARGLEVSLSSNRNITLHWTHPKTWPHRPGTSSPWAAAPGSWRGGSGRWGPRPGTCSPGDWGPSPGWCRWPSASLRGRHVELQHGGSAHNAPVTTETTMPSPWRDAGWITDSCPNGIGGNFFSLFTYLMSEMHIKYKGKQEVLHLYF